MTSNLGSQYAFEADREARDAHYANEVKAFFKPEFVNRIDEIIVFNALNTEVLKKIADKFLAELEKRLSAKQIALTVTDAAKQRIVEMGVDPVFGARPMKRHIQRTIETAVARKILEDPNIEGKRIIVDAGENDYTVSVEEKD